jgi:DNA-binding transcriptional regulator YiaG
MHRAAASLCGGPLRIFSRCAEHPTQEPDVVITGSQVRSLLAALGWSDADLAQRASLPLSAVERAKRAQGEAPITIAQEKAIRAALQTLGRDDLLQGEPHHAGKVAAQPSPNFSRSRTYGRRKRQSAPPTVSEDGSEGHDQPTPVAPQPKPEPRLDVRAIRRRLGMTRAEFGQAFGFADHLLRDWESGRLHPKPAARAYLELIDSDLDQIRSALRLVQRPPG